MITLEQVLALEARVEKALSVIERLTAENAALRESSDRESKRAAELERTVEEFRRDQTKIERGILHALERLNAFEDAILESTPKAETKIPEIRMSHEDVAPRRPAPPQASHPSVQPAEKTSASESASPAGDGASPESGTAEAELEIF